MNRARAIQPVRDTSITTLFSTARIYMDFAAGFYVHRTPSDLTGTPTITAGSGLRATGAGDNVSLGSTAFSSWFNATAGTFFCEFVQNTSGGGTFGRPFEVSDGTTSEFMHVTHNAAQYGLAVTDGGVSQAFVAVAAPAFGTIVRAAARYAANDFQNCINGTLATADTSGTLPTVTQINFGNSAAGTRELNGFVRRFAYFPAVLTNAQLQALTTAG